ncbi:jg14315 [Pararge aegeria aegeria]|uniref:Jg14315 protein n=1 Tax=Pararge aegeria aegeria TaxID=348720 RepID=A0A8S4R8T9_9NEOP|nr:jg14315 [Pararge aegeria aegeria]
MEFENDFSLKEWAKDKPLSILQLDPADRAVLRIADLHSRCLVSTFLGDCNVNASVTNVTLESLCNMVVPSETSGFLQLIYNVTDTEPTADVIVT